MPFDLEPTEVRESPRRDAVLTNLREIYGERNIVVDDVEKRVLCSSCLEHGQEVSFVISFSDLEDATDEVHVFQLSQAYDISDEELASLYQGEYGKSCLHLVELNIVTISQVVVNGVEIKDKLRTKNVRRFRLVVPNLELSHYRQSPGYPVSKETLLESLPDAFWDYDSQIHKRKFGDLETRPVLKEEDLLGLLHECGHGQTDSTLNQHERIKSLTREELAQLKLDMEKVPPGEFNDQQREFALYILEGEESGNREMTKLLEEGNLLTWLFPGETGPQRVVDFQERLIARYRKQYSADAQAVGGSNIVQSGGS